MASPNLKEDLASLRIEQSARAGTGRRGGWLVALVLLLALGGAAWIWVGRDPAVQVTTAAATAASGAASSGPVLLQGSGYVAARRRATVSSKVTGKVLEIFVEEGDAVRQGQVLARLDDAQVRANLRVAEAQLAAARGAAAEDQARLREAQLTLDRSRRLVDEKVLSRAELDTAEAQVASLEARIALAAEQVAVAESRMDAIRTDLADMVVRAPFSGVAVSKDAQPGEMISPVSAGGGFTRTGICTIVDMNSLEIEVDVSEQYINRVRPGQPVEAVLDAYPDWRIPAHVITTVPTADRQKSTVRVRIGFGAAPADGLPRKEPIDPRILPDMGVKTSFLGERAPESGGVAPRARLLVPKAAVRAAGDVSVVFVMKGDRVERRAVKVGQEDGDQVEIASGLSAGERVVVEGAATLADGARVKER